MAQRKQYINSEHYRQMLVRDGDRRFQEWHNAFLKYQKDFLKQTAEIQYVEPSDNTSSSVTPSSAEPTDPFGLFG